MWDIVDTGENDQAGADGNAVIIDIRPWRHFYQLLPEDIYLFFFLTHNF